ncbi:MAG: TonB-dependent receptor [Litorimonas sp.]
MLHRLLLAGSTLALGLSSLSHAQVVEPVSSEIDSADEIVVTGSRIARDPSTTAANPVVALDGAELLNTGRIDIGETLREVPALQGSLPGSLSAINAGDTEDSDLGLSLLNLRNLGVERTLVLQNGRRHVAGTGGQAAVDINTIPALLIDRTEVLTGGASSVYGADAVSGVVNFVLRDAGSFEGIEANIRGGISGEGDSEELFIGAATGFEFAQERGRIVVAGEYSKAEELASSERDFAGQGLFNRVQNTPEVAAAFGRDPNATNTYVPFLTLPISSAGGVITVDDANDPITFGSAFVGVADFAPGPYPTIGSANVPVIQYFDGTNLRNYNAGDIFIDPFTAVGGDAVPTDPGIELLLPDQERYSFNALGELDLNSRLTAFGEFKFVETETLDSVQVNGFNDDIPISLDNPFIPAQLRAQLDGLIADGIDPVVAVSRDVLDIAVQPIPIADRQTVRFVGGFKGELTETFDFELSYNYGRTEVDITNQNTRLEDRYFAALDAVIDPATGQPACRSSVDPTAVAPRSPFPFYSGPAYATFQPGDGQCAPLNIFGPDSISGAGADFAFVDTFDETVLTQKSLLGLVTGDSSDFFSLPGGPIGIAAGFEWREDTSEFTPSVLNQQGFTFGSVSAGPTSPSGGEIDVWQVFAEVPLPLIADAPFAELLEVTASGRISDYDTSGTTETYAIGGRWQPIEPLTIRASFAEAIRVPNVGELFSPQQPATLGATADPCNPQFIGAGTEFRQANCFAIPGIGPGYNSADFNSAFVSGLSGGNPDLDPEEATTYTIGAVLNGTTLGDFGANFLEGFTATVDYYNIDIEGAIGVVAPFQVAANCVDLPSLDNPFCAQIVRDPVDGNIEGFTSGQVNLGALDSEGVDFALRYRTALPGTLGDASFGVAGTRFIKRDVTPDAAQPETISDEIGTFAEPEWIVTGNVRWDFNDLNLGWTVRYEDSTLLPGITNEDLESNPNFADPLVTGDSFVHDFTAGYEFNEDFSVYGGINNVFDREPYLAALTRPVSPRGQYFFAGVRLNY